MTIMTASQAYSSAAGEGKLLSRQTTCSQGALHAAFKQMLPAFDGKMPRTGERDVPAAQRDRRLPGAHVIVCLAWIPLLCLTDMTVTPWSARMSRVRACACSETVPLAAMACRSLWQVSRQPVLADTEAPVCAAARCRSDCEVQCSCHAANSTVDAGVARLIRRASSIRPNRARSSQRRPAAGRASWQGNDQVGRARRQLHDTVVCLHAACRDAVQRSAKTSVASQGDQREQGA
jgi:hypothetical protein